MSTVATAYSLKIGKKTYPIPSFEAASALVCKARDRSGTRSSRFTTPLIFDGAGNQVAYVSYNGRVWTGHPRDWQPNRIPLCEAQV